MGVNPATWQETGVAIAALMVLWKGLDIGAKMFHEDRQKKNGSSDNLKLFDSFKLASTINATHQAMSEMVLGQQDIVAAVRETGRATVEAIATHNDNTNQLAREINKVTRETAE